MTGELARLVRRAVQGHIQAAHPERLEELDAAFEIAFEGSLDALAAGERRPETGPAGDRGLPFDSSLFDLGVVGFTVLVATYLLQTTLARRDLAGLAQRVEELAAKIGEGSRQREAEVRALAREVLAAVESLGLERPPASTPPAAAEPQAVVGLQLLVERRQSGGKPLLKFLLHGAGPGVSYRFQPFGSRRLEKEPAAYFEMLYERIAGYRLHSEEDRRAAARQVRSYGAFLFEALLSIALQDELRRLVATGGPLLVVSEEPWIPWELLKIPPRGSSQASPFLSEAFTLARWLPGPSPAARLPLRRLALVCPGLKENPEAGTERAHLLACSVPGRRRVDEVLPRYGDVTDAMVGGHHDGWHFIAHGRTSKAGAEWWEISLDDRVMTPQDLGDAVAASLRKDRPFVFLNACHTGGSAPGLVDLSGWAPRFLEVGAAAFLAPLWAIPGERAAAFARLVYDRLFAGHSLGEAVRHARRELRSRYPGDPTWLAYALYADPAAVCPRPAAAASRWPAVSTRPGKPTKAWTDKKEYKRLAGRLSNTTGEAYEALVVRLLRPALGEWETPALGLGEGLWALGLAPPYPAVAQVMRFAAAGDELAGEELLEVEACLDRVRRCRLEAARLLLIHNRHAGSKPFWEGAAAALGDLAAAEGIATELWDYQQLLRRAFNGVLDLLVSESQRRSLSLITVREVLGHTTWGDRPLERVPLQTSILLADQHRLIAEEDLRQRVEDPAALALAGGERSITLLLGTFGFGKTTALARTLVGQEAKVFYVPAATISEEVHGAKDLLSRCIDLDRLLEHEAEADLDDYRLLARPVVEYVFKQRKIDAVLVLDGLDESPFLARPDGLQNLVNNLWDLRVPVVLAMRTEFWEDKRQDFEASFGDRAAHGERRVRRIRKLELQPWGEEEIHTFLDRFRERVEDLPGRERLAELQTWLEDGRFEAVYGDIPRRPLFLRLIAETTAAEGLPGRRVGRARLIADAARVKVRRDVAAPRRDGGLGRPSILGRPMAMGETVELAWRAMVAAAACMTEQSSGGLEIHPDCSYDSVRRATPGLEQVDQPLGLLLHSLLRLAAPRSGLQAPRVRFGHRAFQEFFLAWHLVESGHHDAEVPDSVLAWIEDLRRERLVQTTAPPPPGG